MSGLNRYVLVSVLVLLLAGCMGGPQAATVSIDAGPVVASSDSAPPSGDVLFDLRTGQAAELPKPVATGGDSSDYQVSPDGTEIAFESSGVNTTWAIMVAHVDGSGVRRVSDPHQMARSPRWSPDGTGIVYSFETTTTEGISIVDIVTGETTELVHITQPDGLSWPWRRFLQPSFSPDGRRVIFTRAVGNRLDLQTVSAVGGHSTPLIRNGAFGSYSPNGRTIAYLRTGPKDEVGWLFHLGIMLAHADGTRVRRLVGGGGSVMMTPVTVWEPLRPVWSPDGSRLAVAARWAPVAGRDRVNVVDRGTGKVVCSVWGTWPNWADDHTLILEDYHQRT